MREEAEINWPDVSIRQVPQEVSEVFGRTAFTSGGCRICVSTPLQLDGQFGENWFAVGSRNVAVVSLDQGKASLAWTAALEQIRGVKTEKVTGGGLLVIDKQGRPEEVLRFDVGHAGLFGEIAGCLHKHVAPAKKKEDGAEVEEEAGPLDFAPLLKKQRALHCGKCWRQYPKNTKICPFCVQRGSTLSRILKYALPFRRNLLLMAGLMVSGMVVQLAPPQIYRILVDDVLVSRARQHLVLPLVGLLALLMVVSHLISIFRARLGVFTGCAVTASIQKTVFRHLQGLSLSYFNKQQTGALMARVNHDTQQMEHFLVDGVQYTVINLLVLAGVAGMLIWMNPVLGVLVLIPTPLVVLISRFVWQKVIRRFRLLWAATAAVSGYLNDALSGIRVIKAFGQETVEIGRYEEKLNYACDQLIVAERTWQTLVPVLNLLVQSSMLLVWYFGSFQVYGGQLTLGELLAYVAYLTMIFGPLQLLSRLNDWLGRSLTAAARVFEVLDAKTDIEDARDARAMPEMEGRIALRGVVFGYEKHNPVLKGVDYEIQAGQMIGLVGPSGAGKSTLINLVGRLYDADEGAIMIDGVDVRKIRLVDLRKHIGYVLQDTFLFNGTVAENIAYARPEASREEIIAAAVTANAHDFIMKLPDGYDTIMGERGARVSGGERQRISIARAVLHNPKILILDEATASVDTETESKIQAALRQLVKGRTTIAIAHRLSTLRHAHRLVVLEGGRIKEEGTHAELMGKKGGVYKKLVDIQTEWNRSIAVGG